MQRNIYKGLHCSNCQSGVAPWDLWNCSSSPCAHVTLLTCCRTVEAARAKGSPSEQPGEVRDTQFCPVSWKHTSTRESGKALPVAHLPSGLPSHFLPEALTCTWSCSSSPETLGDSMYAG